MKRTIFLVLVALMVTGLIWAQGFETFSNSAATATYLDGSFTGDDAFTWTYGHSRDEGDYPIDGNGLMLRRASDSYLEAVIPGGIGNFSLQYRKAFTGTAVRQLELIINGVQVATTDEFGPTEPDPNIYTFTVNDINQAGNVTIKIKNVGTTTTNRQTVIDNISWTGYTTASPILFVNPNSLTGFTYEEGNGPSAPQSFELTGTNLDGTDVTITPPTNFFVSVSSLTAYNGLPIMIDVQLDAGLTVGLYSGDITISGGGADPITVAASGEVLPMAEPFAIPYFNAFRSQADVDLALIHGFTIENYAITTYLRLITIGSYVETPLIDFTQYDALDVTFFLATYGGALGQTVSLMVSNNGGIDYDVITTFSPTSTTYEECSSIIDLTGLYNVTEGRLKMEMTAGGGSTRFQDLSIDIASMLPVATPVFDPVGGEYYAPQTVSISTETLDASIEYSYDSADGPWIPYTGDLFIDESKTVWAYAYKDGMLNSPVVSATYTIPVPAYTTIPYEETFDSDLGDCYTYSVSGDTKYWLHSSSGQYAYMNGFNSGDLEEDWLILPGITLNNDDVLMIFETWRNFGSDNVDNYFKLMYSTDYAGVGDPSSVLWTELIFTQPTSNSTWTSSGNIDLSGIVGDPIYIGFKYHYNVDYYVSWQVDNINIFEASTPMITADPSDLTGMMRYMLLEGPSNLVSTTIEVVNIYGNFLDIAVIGLDDSDFFEIALEDGESRTEFGSQITVPVDGDLTITLLVRMKADLPVGYYSDSIQITVGGGIVDPVIIPVDGEVLAIPPGIPYSQNFSSFVSYETLPEGWVVSNQTYIGDWGTGTTAGLRGNANVLGFQHASATGIFTATLTLINDTGGTIEELYVSYLGMVARADQGRSPEWTVKLDGVEIPELFYSTVSGINEKKFIVINGLSIASNEVFSISWSSDRGLPEGASKQIGISDVIVTLPGTLPLPAIKLFPEDMADIAPGFTFSWEPNEYGPAPDGYLFGVWWDPLSCEGICPIPFPISEYPEYWIDLGPVTSIVSTDPIIADYFLTWPDWPWWSHCNWWWWEVWPYVYIDGERQILPDRTRATNDRSEGNNLRLTILPLPYDGTNFWPWKFHIWDPEEPLPVELSSFMATYVAASQFVELQWVSETETNMLGFNVYRNTAHTLNEAVKVNTVIVPATNTSNQQRYNFVDESVSPDMTYYYWLELVQLDLTNGFHGPTSVLTSPEDPGTPPNVEYVTRLIGAYPNPFNPGTNIMFELSETANVSIVIYNMRGQLVKTLVSQNEYQKGQHSLFWDGTDSRGNASMSGVYFYHFRTSTDYDEYKKMMLMK